MLSPEKFEVLRNLRDGDVVWIVVAPDVSDDDVEALHDACSSGIDAKVTVFVTPSDLVEGVRVMGLESLLSLRDVVDAAIVRLAAEAVTES